MILNNIYKKLIKNRFYKKIFIFSILIIITINLLTIGIIYYWSFYYYNHIFEDRIIDQETLKYNKELGVENTWLLGVNTHSIDVLEATYNKTIPIIPFINNFIGHFNSLIIKYNKANPTKAYITISMFIY